MGNIKKISKAKRNQNTFSPATGMDISGLDNELSALKRDPRAASLSLAVNSGQARFYLSPDLFCHIANDNVIEIDPIALRNLDLHETEIDAEAQRDNLGKIFHRSTKFSTKMLYC